MSKTYETGNKATKDVSLTADNDKFVSAVGKNGSGKDMLTKLLLKEPEPTKGRTVVNDMGLGRMLRRCVPKYRRRLGVVSQDFRLPKDRTVLENAALAQRVIGISPRIIRGTVPGMLRLVGLSSKYKAHSRQLSGGEQQRVVTARALIDGPGMLLVDEFAGNLDGFNTHEITRPLEEINQRGTIVIVTTRGQKMADEMNKRITTIEWGSVINDVGGYY